MTIPPFTAQEVRGKTCKGCLFADERASTCREVERIASLSGMPDCEYPSRLLSIRDSLTCSSGMSLFRGSM